MIKTILYNITDIDIVTKIFTVDPLIWIEMWTSLTVCETVEIEIKCTFKPATFYDRAAISIGERRKCTK